MLRWGVGVSRGWRDWDSLAWSDSEIVGLSAADGMEPKVDGVASPAVSSMPPPAISTAASRWSRFPAYASSTQRPGRLEFGFAAGINLGGDAADTTTCCRVRIRRDF